MKITGSEAYLHCAYSSSLVRVKLPFLLIINVPRQEQLKETLFCHICQFHGAQQAGNLCHLPTNGEKCDLDLQVKIVLLIDSLLLFSVILKRLNRVLIPLSCRFL